MILKRQLGLVTAIFIVIASMIGTGIFVTTGTVLGITQNALVILILWGVAGLVAISGALCYAELATIWPHVGGEYIYLKNTFGLLPSFLTGWISLIVGFSAPVALGALTLFDYFDQFFLSLNYNEKSIDFLFGTYTKEILASTLIFLLGVVHIFGVKKGSFLQNILTAFKLLLILSLIFAGFYFVQWDLNDRLFTNYASDSGKQSALAQDIGLALLIIMFSFSGWNGASYIAGEIKNPKRNLPSALFYGTLITTVIYIALNVLFIIASPGSEIMSNNAIGAITTKNLFGAENARYFTIGIVVILLSSIAAQIMIGPRVYYAMARDKIIFQNLGKVHSRYDTPATAITLQIVISVVYVFAFGKKIDDLLLYMGFTLSIFPLLTVIALIYLRVKQPQLERHFKVPLYPVLPVFFILLTTGMMIAGIISKPEAFLVALAVLLLGVPIYFIWKKTIAKGH